MMKREQQQSLAAQLGEQYSVDAKHVLEVAKMIGLYERGAEAFRMFAAAFQLSHAIAAADELPAGADEALAAQVDLLNSSPLHDELTRLDDQAWEAIDAA
jgi:hypothetical protein